jgi:glycosyltransferase involved in cell wall biosynthesis
VHVIVPDGIDDPREPSGGNAYDRRVCLGLAAAGWTVHEHAAAGAWPQPDLDAGGDLHRILAGVPDDSVVLIDGLVACGIPDVVIPHARRLRLVVLLHLPLGDELGRTPALAASLAGRERETLRAASAVVATSAWAARRVVALHGLEPGRVHVASPGVDPAPPATGTDGVSRLLCVGAVTPTKGQDLLVEALAAVALPADRRWRCDLVGPLHRAPAHVAGVRAAIDRHGLDGRVRLPGPLSGSQLAATYDAADLLVLPSRAETYGMVVTEALARGIPVLATAVGGVPDTLGVPKGPLSPRIRPSEPAQTSTSTLIRHRADGGGVAGILVAPDDVAALAAALGRWFDEPELRADLRRCAAGRHDTLTGWEVTARCLAHVLDGLNGP